MRCLPVQFRLRTLMIVMVVVALVLGGVAGAAAERRRAYYRSRVETFAWGEADLIERIADDLKAAREADARGPEGVAEARAARERAESLARLAAWHVKMERRYAWAAEHPWASLPPEPSPPSF